MLGHRDQYCMENGIVRNVHDDDDDNNKVLLMSSMLNVATKKLIHTKLLFSVFQFVAYSCWSLNESALETCENENVD